MYAKDYDKVPLGDSETYSDGDDTVGKGSTSSLLEGGEFVPRERKSRVRRLVVYAALVCLWVASLVAVDQYGRTRHCKSGMEVGFDTDLKPLRDVLEVHQVKFQGRLDFDENGTLIAPPHEGIQYTGEPTDALDNAWKALIPVDAVDLIGADADTVRDKTLMKASGHSIVGIDGFHQIHCLNMLRKALRPDKYPLADPEDIYQIHLNHCIDYIRQILMCNIDITPQLVSWSTEANRPHTNFESVHTCRNYSKIRDWVVEHSGLKHPLPYDESRPKPIMGWVDLNTVKNEGGHHH